MLRRMGPLQGVMKMIPGMGQLADADIDESKLKRVEAVVLSMTPRERAMPHTIDGKRRQRIANGSGTTVQDVNQLLEARKMMEKMMGQMGKGKMPAHPRNGGADGRRSAGGADPCRGPARAPLRSEETEGQQEAVRSSVTYRHGSQAPAHSRGLQEESDLPRRRGRLALAA